MYTRAGPVKLRPTQQETGWAQIEERTRSTERTRCRCGRSSTHDLRRRLEAGEFADKFPPEMDLVAQYDVSRNTVREAMRRLRGDGVVVASRGRRPRLAEETEIVQPLGALYSLFASVEASGLEQRSVVLALELGTDAGAAAHLGRPPSQSLLYLERLRLAGGEPLALDRVWMPAELGVRGSTWTSPTPASTTSSSRPGRGCPRRVGVEQTARWCHPRATAPCWGSPGRTAALAIDRLSCAKGEPVEWRHTLVRGDRFSVVAEFSGRERYQFDVSDLSPPAPAGPGPGTSARTKRRTS